MISTIKQNKMGQPPNFFWEGGRGEGTPPTPPFRKSEQIACQLPKNPGDLFSRKVV